MRFEQQLAVNPSHFHGNIDQPHRRADRDQRKQCLHVIGVHANATVRDSQSHRNRIVGAVNEVGTLAGGEPHGVRAERIVGPRFDLGRQRIAGLGVLLAHRFGRIPRWIFLLLNHMRDAERRAPIHLADAHRIGNDLDRAAAFGFRIVIKSVLGKIDDDSLVWTGREDMPSRHHQLLPRSWQPGVDARIDSDQFFGTQAELGRQVVEGVLIDRFDGGIFAHHGVIGFGEGVGCRVGTGQCGEHQARHKMVGQRQRAAPGPGSIEIQSLHTTSLARARWV